MREDFRSVTVENPEDIVFPDSAVQALCKAFLQWKESNEDAGQVREADTVKA